MGIFDDAWKMAALKKQCRYCNEPAVKWKGGKYYCADCYEDRVVAKPSHDFLFEVFF